MAVKILVAEAGPDFVGFDAGPAVVRDQVAKEYREEHRQVQAHGDALREAKIDADALLIKGPIIETILNEAQRFNADLLISGSVAELLQLHELPIFCYKNPAQVPDTLGRKSG